jgi:hypothetical protein
MTDLTNGEMCRPACRPSATRIRLRCSGDIDVIVLGIKRFARSFTLATTR